jgi:hypothetical protein
MSACSSYSRALSIASAARPARSSVRHARHHRLVGVPGVRRQRHVVVAHGEQRAPGRQPRHDQLGHQGHGHLLVEGAGEQAAGLGEKAEPAAPGPLQLHQAGAFERGRLAVGDLLEPLDVTLVEVRGVTRGGDQQPDPPAVDDERRGDQRPDPGGPQGGEVVRAAAQIGVDAPAADRRALQAELQRGALGPYAGGRLQHELGVVLGEQDVDAVGAERVLRGLGGAVGELVDRRPGRPRSGDDLLVRRGRRRLLLPGGARHGEPDLLVALAVRHAPGDGQRLGEQQATAADLVAGNGDPAGLVPVVHLDPHLPAERLAHDLHLGPRVHDCVRNQFAGE